MNLNILKKINRHIARYIPLILIFILCSCSSGGSENSFKFLDSTSDGDVADCLVSNSTPNVSALKVASGTGTITSFAVVPNSSICSVRWKLNGVSIASATPFLDLAANNINYMSGVNTLTAEVSKAGGSVATRTWAITRNTPSACISQTPAATGNSMNYNAILNLQGSISNPDSDSITFGWTENDATSNKLGTIINTVSSSQSIYSPNSGDIATSKTLKMTFNDGYDSGYCSWTVDVIDPTSVTITSCTPTSNPVVIHSTGAESARTFTVTATGPSLAYTWHWNSSADISAATASSLIQNKDDASIGNHTLTAEVRDAYGNMQSCVWNVKRNAPPSIAGGPDNTVTNKLAYNNSLIFNPTVTDANGDSLTIIEWTLDSAINAALPTGATNTTLTPASNSALLGSKTVRLTVSDGYETATKSWPIEINMFSQSCNTVLNGSSSLLGGYGCTLAGQQTMGHGLIPTTDQTKIKIRPSSVIPDSSGNYFITDSNMGHLVAFYNTSAVPVTRVGRSIDPFSMQVLVGNGGAGRNDDSSSYFDFKLYDPMAVAYDETEDFLYVADYSNNRVVKVDNTGVATTIFGGGANNLAGNTNGSLGTAHSCGNPAGLVIATVSSEKRLYISCRSTHAIKYMVADPLSADYGKGYMAAGRLNASSATVASNNSGSLGTVGTAGVNEPWQMAKDSNNNIYWIERIGARIRMINNEVSNKTFFSNQSVTGNIRLYANDVSTASAYSTTMATVAGQHTASAPNSLVVFGLNNIVTNSCVPLTVQSRLSSATAANVSSNTTVTLTPGANTTFYATEANCLGLVSAITTVQINSGTSEASFFIRRSANAAAQNISATAAGLGSVNYAVTSQAVGATPTQLVVVGASSFQYLACTPVTIQVRNGSNVPTASTGSRTISLGSEGIGSFYTNSSCTGTPINYFTLSAGEINRQFYFSTKVVAVPNEVTSLVGNAITSGTQTLGAAGQAQFPDPRGLAVHTSGANVLGFFVSTVNGVSNVYYVNNHSADAIYGGTTLKSLSATANGVNHESRIVAGTGGSAFNGDDFQANLVSMNQPYGIGLNSTQTSLLISDFSNYRIRSLDLSTANGWLSTVLGQGRSRYTFETDNTVSAQEAVMQRPTMMTYDSATKELYISDTYNYRIRKINMQTGAFGAAIGRGFSETYIENEDLLNVFMRGPRGTALFNDGSRKVLLIADSYDGGTIANRNCRIRAANLGSSSISFFGETIGAGKISSIAGDYVTGCGTFNGTGAASSRRLFWPWGVATDNTNIVTTQYNDHCILKIDGTAAPYNVTVLAGLCGTAGTVDGNTNVSRIRFPKGIKADPLNPGNYFFVDQLDQATGRIRYINTLGSSVTFGSGGGAITVAAPTGGQPANIRTVYTFAPLNTTSRLNDIAMYNNIICYASGQDDSTAGAATGGHVVMCVDRTSNATAERILGPDPFSPNFIRGGAPLNQEQENVDGLSMRLSGPAGLAFDENGNLFVTDTYNGLVRVIRKKPTW